MDEGTASSQEHTFRRFKTGKTMWNWPDLSGKIFQADHSYKCPTYVHRTPPCQDACPTSYIQMGLGE